MDKVLRLYNESVSIHADRAREYAMDRRLSLAQHEFDALTIQAYNGTYYDVMDAFGDMSLTGEEALDKALDTYRGFKNWDKYANGWTNRKRRTINLYRHGEY